MTLLPVLALFVVMRGYKISRILALVLAVGFLYSPINFPTSPKVSHFVVILLLVGAFVANRSKSGVLQSAVFVLTALLAAYVRPEYFLSFLLMLGIWVIQLIRSWNGQELRNKVISVGGVIVPCLFLFLALGIPVGKRDQNMAAFR
jgi:hypothetical protein